MKMEASIIQRLNELRQWQIQQQERLLKQQQEQRETLSYQQDCIFRALELSVQNIACDNSAVDADISTEINNSDIINISLQTEPKLQLSTSNSNDILHIKNSLETISLTNDNISENKNNEVNLDLEEQPCNSSCMTRGFLDNKPRDKQCRNNLNQNCINSNFESDNKAPTIDFLMEGIAPLPMDKPSKKSIVIDEIPVPSPKKDFQSLLEEKLKDCENTLKENVKPNSKENTKRPFLKKGQGLARFRLNKPLVETTQGTRPRSSSLSSNTKPNAVTRSEKKKDLVTKNNCVKKKVSVPNVRQQLSLKNVPPPKKKDRGKPVSALPALRQAINSADLSSSDIESKTQRELEEVRMFELLEEKAENSSFCSTSSTVQAFLQQSSPFKIKRLFGQVKNDVTDLKYKSDQRGNKQPLSRVDENFARSMEKSSLRTIQSGQTPNRVVDAYWESITHTQENRFVSLTENPRPFNDRAKNVEKDVYDVETHAITRNFVERLSDRQPYETNNPTNDNETDISLHVRFSEYNEYKTIGLTDTSSESSESSNVYADERAWSDCSPVPSSYEQILPVKCSNNEDAGFLLSDEKEETQEEEVMQRKMRGEWNSEEHDDEDLEDLESLRSICSDEEKEQVHDSKSEFDKDDTPLSEGNEDEDTPNTSIQSTASVKQRNIDESSSKNSGGIIFKSELLKTRLLELEREIDIFRKENAALSTQRIKLQEERESLYREMKEKHEELERMRIGTEERLNEEKKKLTRDKAAFEIRIRDAQEKNQLYKLERQEMQKLKLELHELREEMREKESRWNAAHSRQKSQLRILKVENTKLKSELEQLENARKNVQRKKASNYSNSRAMNRINKQVDGYMKIVMKEPVSEEDEDKQVKAMVETLRQTSEERNDPPTITRGDDGKSSESLQQTVDRAVKKRNLYEHLLKEAVTGLMETEEPTKPTAILGKQKGLSTGKLSEGQAESVGNAEAKKIDRTPRQDGFSSWTSREKCSSASRTPNTTPQETSETASDAASQENVKVVRGPDGCIEHWYPNGNVKKTFPERGVTKILYYNGDVCETEENGNVKYFYASTRTWHTTMPDGLEILEFPDGQVERRSRNGNIEISFPDGSLHMLQPNGTEKWVLPDGTVAETFSNGEKILNFPNGQREVHTQQHKRREYPDGTVKIVYPDGSQETRYFNGRVRLKDKDGNLLMDSQQ